MQELKPRMTSTSRFDIKSLIPPVSINVIIACAIWYLISSMTSQSTKSILTSFPFPSFVGQLQFLISSIYCFFIAWIMMSYPKLGSQFPKGTIPNSGSGILMNKILLKTTLPLGIFQCLGKFCSLAATSRVPVATVASIKALSPLLIVTGYRFYYRVKFPVLTYVSLIPLMLGVVVIVMADSSVALAPKVALGSEHESHDHSESEVDSHWNGVIFAIISTIIFASQNIYAKNVLTYSNNNTITNSMITNNTAPVKLAINKDPSTLNLTLMDENYRLPRVEQKELEQDKVLQNSVNYEKDNNSLKPISLRKVIAINNNSNTDRNDLTQSGNNSITAKPDKLTILFYCSSLGFIFQTPLFLYELITRQADIDITKIPISLILLNGTSHCLQALMAFHLLGTIPTVTYSIASMMKRIVIITVSIIVAGHDGLNGTQFLGLLLTAVGLYTYDRWGDSKKFGST